MSWLSLYIKRKAFKRKNLLDALSRNKLKIKQQNELREDQKFVSFFRCSMLPSRLITKFDILIENTEEELETGKFRKFLTPANRKKVKNLMRGFYLILFVIFYMYSISQQLFLSKKNIYTVKTFDYLNKHNFNYYFSKIKIFQDFIKTYVLDQQYNKTYIYYFNLYLFYQLKYFEVLLNFEDYKYELDKILRPDWNIEENYPRFYKPSAKEKKPARMSTDFYDYIKRKNRVRVITKYSLRSKRVNEIWNIVAKGPDNEDLIKEKRDLKNKKKHLVRHDNLYFFYIIYEFGLKIHDKLLANYFNYDFFGKVKIFQKIEKKDFNLKNEIKILSSPYIFLSESDKDLNEVNENNIENFEFNTQSYLINIKYYRIKMPFLFFLLYTTYSIFHRRARYNLYVRGDLFFQEHFSKMYYFLWINAGNGRISQNPYYPLYQGQKLHTYYFLSNHVEFKWFNNWFTFYYCYYSKLANIFFVQNAHSKSLFYLLLSNSFVLNLIDKKNLIEYFYEKSYFRTQYLYELYNGYYLFMEKMVTKFDKLFAFAHFSYFKYESMMKNVYLVPYDKRYLMNYLTKKTALINYFNIIIDTNYINFYFLNDFFNLKKDTILNQTIKSLNFYNKMFRIIFLVLDPFFFKHFYKKCFPRQVTKLVKCVDYIIGALLSVNFIYEFEYEHELSESETEPEDLNKFINVEFNVPKFSFLMYYLYWRIDTSNMFVFNFAYSNYILQTNVAINSIYKQRFKDLALQMNFLLKKNKVSHIYRDKYYYTMDILKSHYLELLLYNMEYILLFFFLNLNKYSKLLLNLKINPFMKFVYSTLIYRYYIYNIWLESRYYDDWFNSWDKRIFWIYKSFWSHEGQKFYSKPFEII